MSRERTLERTLVLRVVAVLAVGLAAVTGILLATLALHLRAAANDTLATAVGVVARADAAGATLTEPRVARVLPAGGVVALVTTDGVVRTVAPDAVDVAALPVDATPGQGLRFIQDDRVYVGEAIATGALTLRTEDGAEEAVVTVLIALDVSDDRATIARMSAIAVTVALIASMVLAAVARTVVRRSLAPVREIAEASARIARTGAPEPLPTDGPYEETSTLAAAVEDALRRRLEAERAVRDFVADASHELRTPVAKIQGWGEVALSTDPGDPRGRHAIERSVGAAEELAAIVDELGLLARLDARPASVREPVDVAALAREVAADAGVVQPSARLTITADADLPGVEGDAVALTRALRNLVGNALQHGGGTVNVRVSADGDHVAIDVADDGPGVPVALRGRVFDRFFSTAPGNPRHAGLGLAIIDAVARSHGGTVELLDRGPGATFRLRLPAAR